MSFSLLFLLPLACSEYRVIPPEPAPVADPPGGTPDDFGDPPDWTSCNQGFRGLYQNLPESHPDIIADLQPEDGLPDLDLDNLDWWDSEYRSFERYDASLDLGAAWWPVDEGLAGDPDYFAVRWLAWIRVYSSGTVSVNLGAASDAWILVNEELLASQSAPEFLSENVDLDLKSGQYPLDLRMGQRAGDDAGFRFRVLSGDVQICYPDYSAEK